MLSAMQDKQQPMTKRWGALLDGGFLMLPTLLLRKQSVLGLSDGEIVALLNFLASWWEEDDLPYLGATQIARRMDISHCTARRHIRRLREKGFIRAIPGTPSKTDPDVLVTRYDLSGTIKALSDLAVGREGVPATNVARQI